MTIELIRDLLTSNPTPSQVSHDQLDHHPIITCYLPTSPDFTTLSLPKFRHPMENRMLKVRDVLLYQHPYIVMFVLALSFIVMDPFRLSPVGGHDFRPVENEIAPYQQVMESWPWDNGSLLGLGNLEFKDEIFGPESLEFDVLGRGPYAGLADGRVVRWMGKDAGWETFALVTQNW